MNSSEACLVVIFLAIGGYILLVFSSENQCNLCHLTFVTFV